MDNTQIDDLLGRVTACKTAREAGTTLATGIGELVKQAARGGNPSVECEDLGAALQARADDIGLAVGEGSKDAQQGKREPAGSASR